VKITDFGIAHAAGSAPITQVGTLVGTPAYLAPERAAGKPATPASDLYSLGIVAYECLTGSTPFHGTPLEVATANRFGSLPPLPAAVPAPVTALVSDLTARDPAARPGSAAEVAARAAQLRDAMNGGRDGLSGRPATLSSAAITSHTAVLPDLQAPATEMLDWPAAAPPGRPAAGRRPGRVRAGWVAGLAVVLVALGWPHRVGGWRSRTWTGSPTRMEPGTSGIKFCPKTSSWPNRRRRPSSPSGCRPRSAVA
jgi:eukaryotic-like serine/threonine-protein kinase